jgi:hypothetical protein
MHDVRRLAPASVFVVQRHAGKASIAAYAPRMVPLANEVLVAIQDLDMLKADQVKLIAASDAQNAELNGKMLGWSGHLVHDLEGFEIGAYTRDVNLSFDVVQKAFSLKRFVEEKGVDLPYRETLLTELTARIESASGMEQAAQMARGALQEKQREVRELTARFHAELVNLRRTVRAELGSSHVDYQRLRVLSRAAAAEPPDGTTPVTEPSETETARKPDA